MKSYPYAECQLCRNRMLPPYKGCGPCRFGSNYNPVEIELRSVVGMYHTSTLMPPIRRVIFNDPATIVFWADGTKTVVKAYNEVFDPEKGLAMAIAKKAMGNGSYYPEIKKWTNGYSTEETNPSKLSRDLTNAATSTFTAFETAMRKVAEAVSGRGGTA